MSEKIQMLYYGQKVFMALPRCACSDTVHDISYTKVGMGYVRKYNEDTDTYMVEVINSDTSKVNTYCCCDGYNVGSSKPEIKEIKHEHLFVLDIKGRCANFDNKLLYVGNIVNIYPKADKYQIISISSDLNLILACSTTGIAANGTIDPTQLVIVDLSAEDTFITFGDGDPVIIYRYEDGIPEEAAPIGG